MKKPCFLLAGSTHKGEEEILFSCLASIKKQVPVTLCIAPRDVTRASTIQKLAASRGFYARKLFSPGTHPNPPDVIIVDAMGVLLPLYGLCDIAFVGGSLVPEGGHNPLEPASLGRPTLFGPHISDFPQAAGDLLKANGAFMARDEKELLTILEYLAKDSMARFLMGQNAREAFLAKGGAGNLSADRLLARMNQTDH